MRLRALHATLNHVGPASVTDTDTSPHEADPSMLELSLFPLIATEYITKNANSHILHVHVVLSIVAKINDDILYPIIY